MKNMDSIETDEKISSPCIQVCVLNDDEICLGCFRNLEEISAWSQSDEYEKQKIIEAAELRRIEHELLRHNMEIIE